MTIGRRPRWRRPVDSPVADGGTRIPGDLWSKGHRLFFFGAGLFACVSIAEWLGILAGRLPAPGWASPAQWHAHEMLFGYTVAVLAGFILIGTAGWRIAALGALWLAGRVAMAVPDTLPAGAVAAVDLAFAPALALLRTPPLWNPVKWPTTGFLPLLAGLFAANALWHLGALGALRGGADVSERLALDFYVLMMTVMAGRLVPGYTRAALIPLKAPRDPARERWSIVLAILAAAADLLTWRTPFAALSAALGLLQAVRLSGWRTAAVLRRPLLLVLHVGFGWLALGLVLRGAAEFGGWMHPTDALHAVTIGAIGMLTLGMMGRLARTHGRLPLAASATMMASYAAVAAAALARVIVPVLAPSAIFAGWLIAGILWIAGFALFLVEHGGILIGARRPGRD